MSILTHIVLAKSADGGALLEHHPAHGWPHVDLQSLDDRHLMALYALLLPPGAARDMDEGEGFSHIPASEPTNPDDPPPDNGFDGGWGGPPPDAGTRGSGPGTGTMPPTGTPAPTVAQGGTAARGAVSSSEVAEVAQVAAL